jgi:hypothetical protein
MPITPKTGSFLHADSHPTAIGITSDRKHDVQQDETVKEGCRAKRPKLPN